MWRQLWPLLPVLSQEVNDVEGVSVPHTDGQVQRRLSGLLSAKQQQQVRNGENLANL